MKHILIFVLRHNKWCLFLLLLTANCSGEIEKKIVYDLDVTPQTKIDYVIESERNNQRKEETELKTTFISRNVGLARKIRAMLAIQGYDLIWNVGFDCTLKYNFVVEGYEFRDWLKELLIELNAKGMIYENSVVEIRPAGEIIQFCGKNRRIML